MKRNKCRARHMRRRAEERAAARPFKPLRHKEGYPTDDYRNTQQARQLGISRRQVRRRGFLR